MIIPGITNTVLKTISGSDGMGKVKFHATLQRRVARLANKYGFSGYREYEVPDRGDGRRGFIDVVWMDRDVLIAAIEIDSRLRKKSVVKLKSANALYKIWIYYGNCNAEEPCAFWEDIIVIHIPRFS